jgi:hypothetical protein
VKLALVLVVAACGTPPPAGLAMDAGACEPYKVPATQDLTMPARTFSDDVLPLLTTHCVMCHGTTDDPSGNLFLGKSASDAATVYKNLVGMPSGEYADMSFVTVSDPTRSYLMHKLDGDQCQYDAMCGGGTCEQNMPMIGGELAPAQRDAIREWIYQGAQDN